MLVLSRRRNEAIVLPGLNVTIRVAAVKGGAVRLGIEAPSHVDVFREELLGRARPGNTRSAEPPCPVSAAG